MANALQQIVREAKRIRRLHPNKYRKWTGFVKEASAKYRGGSHKTKAKKTTPKVKKRRRSAAPHSAPGRKVNGLTTAQLTSALKSKVNDKIDRAVILKFHATKKSLKRKYQKQITAGKAQLRKLC